MLLFLTIFAFENMSFVTLCYFLNIDIDWSLISCFDFNAETHWKKLLAISVVSKRQTSRGFCYEVEKKFDTQVSAQTYYNFHILLCIWILIFLAFFVNFKSKCRLKELRKFCLNCLRSNLMTTLCQKPLWLKCKLCRITGLGSFVLFWFLK